MMLTKGLNSACQFLFLTLTLFTNWAEGHIRSVCYSENLPVVLLYRDAVTGEFSVVEHNIVPGDLGHYRWLQQEVDTSSSKGSSSSSFSAPLLRKSSQANSGKGSRFLEVDSEEIPGDTLDSDNFFYAYECSCFQFETQDSTLYCPFATTACRESIDNHGPYNILDERQCETVTSETRDLFVTSSFFLLLSMVGIGFASLVSTHKGRSALSLIPSILTGGRWNEWQADRLMNHHPDQANYLIWTHLRLRQIALQRQAFREIQRQQRNRSNTDGPPGEQDISPENAVPQGDVSADNASEPEPERQPTSLVLKTRFFRNDSPRDPERGESTTTDMEGFMEEEYQDGHGCVICMTALEDGDRVGVLPCDHIFHVKCLKPWLQRNNACPLCKRQTVATPQYDKVDAGEEDGESSTQPSSSFAPGDSSVDTENVN